MPSTSKPNAMPIDSDSDDGRAPKSKPVKRKSTAVESSSEEEVKPKKAAAPKKIVPKKVGATKKKAVDDFVVDDEEEEEEESGKKGKGKAVAKKPPAKRAKKEEAEEDGQEKPEKKKWVFKPKTGPVNPGGKEVPPGEDNCLAGLTFVFTGELDSFSREEGQDLVKRYGGRVTSAPSSKTSFVVLGRDAGPSKLKMIDKHKIKTLDEDGFLELIGSRPSGADDPKFIEQQKKEQAKVKETAKKMGPAKDAPETLAQLWTTKYAPTKLNDICGNKGNVEKLSRWLEAWPKTLKSDFKKPGPDAMGAFRCILISGPPGIGKTTAAHLVANLLGYNILELNASDTRSKKLLESAFRTTIENTTLAGFFRAEGEDPSDPAHLSVNQKSVIIMDEVDGMSAGDRGGVGALNALIKKTKVPIIAICNDKTSPKMKPLAHTCFQMIFKRPSANEIRSRMMSVAYKEKIKIDAKVLDQLVAGSQSDIRQIINMLSTWNLGAKAMDFDEGKKLARMSEKNTIQTPWSLYSKLFGPQSFSSVSGMTLNDKLDLYFNDHQIMPLFVQDNYLKANFSKSNGLTGPDKVLKDLDLAAKAAEAISDGDLVDAMIHGGQQQWSLMPVHGVFSCVRPAYFCHGQGGGQPGFPSWFGKNSTQTKLQRMLGEIQIRMRLRVSGDRKEIRQSYIPTLFPLLVQSLQERGAEAIEEVIQLMDDYYLTKEDWEAIVEMGVGEGYENDATLKKIPTAVKSAFTRMYNKVEHPVPFRKADDGAKPKRMAGGPAPDQEDVVPVSDEEEEEIGSAGEEADNGVGKDKMIKKKGKAAPKKAAAKKKT